MCPMGQQNEHTYHPTTSSHRRRIKRTLPLKELAHCSLAMLERLIDDQAASGGTQKTAARRESTLTATITEPRCTASQGLRQSNAAILAAQHTQQDATSWH